MMQTTILENSTIRWNGREFEGTCSCPFCGEAMQDVVGRRKEKYYMCPYHCTLHVEHSTDCWSNGVIYNFRWVQENTEGA